MDTMSSQLDVQRSPGAEDRRDQTRGRNAAENAETLASLADCEEVKPELVGARVFRGLEPAQRPLNGASSRSEHAVLSSN